MRITAYSDGGSRGNPGPSAYAIVITKDGSIIHQKTEFLGVQTNNYAEYRGLIAAIVKTLEYDPDEAEFVMDSELVIKQMNGAYSVRSPNIKELHEDAKVLSGMIPKVTFTHVRRSNNLISRADALLNKTMDENTGMSKRR